MIVFILAVTFATGEPSRETQFIPEVNDAMLNLNRILWIAIALTIVLAIAAGMGMVDPRMEPPI